MHPDSTSEASVSGVFLCHFLSRCAVNRLRCKLYTGYALDLLLLALARRFQTTISLLANVSHKLLAENPDAWVYLRRMEW